MACSLPDVLRAPAVIAVLAALLSGCGGPVAVPEMSASPSVNPCYVPGSGGPVRDTVVVVVPKARAERFLAAHVIAWKRLPDCMGHSVPLASASFRAISLDPAVLVPSPAGRSGPSILLRTFGPGTDLRDVIDSGADVVITADPAALAYARGRGDLRLVPLAWAVTYALIVPPGSPLPVDTSVALRGELARDVVPGEARPADLPFWWHEATPCMANPRDPAGRLPDIGYPAGDSAAQALAERLLAVAPAPRRRLLPLGPSAFNYALSLGTVAAYVAPFPRLEPPQDCQDVPPVPRGSLVVPLVDTRTTAVVRPGVPPFLQLADGTILFLHSVDP